MSCGTEGALPIGLGGARYAMESDTSSTLALVGSDRDGEPWVLTFACRYGFEGWAAHLAGDGVRDFVLSEPTGGNGLAAPYVLHLLTFGADGRPTSFSVPGYYYVEGRHLLDLTDADGDGRAELLVMGFDDGYWWTDRNETDGTSWTPVGAFGGRTYPLFTRFTQRPSAVAPPADRRPQVPRLDRGEPDYAVRRVA